MGFFLRGDDDNTGFVSSECEIAWSTEISYASRQLSARGEFQVV